MNPIEIEDGFGGGWLGCRRGADCGLEVVRPGKVQCWCDYRTADGSCLHWTGSSQGGVFTCGMCKRQFGDSFAVEAERTAALKADPLHHDNDIEAP